MLELLPLAEIENEGHHLGIMLTRHGGDVGRARRTSRERHEDAPAHERDSLSRRLTSARARRASGAMARIVSSPAIVPTTSGSRAPSRATPSSCAWPGP